jgi:hypothetical protein
VESSVESKYVSIYLYVRMNGRPWDEDEGWRGASVRTNCWKNFKKAIAPEFGILAFRNVFQTFQRI